VVGRVKSYGFKPGKMVIQPARQGIQQSKIGTSPFSGKL
jgi:hypothetical protein